MVYFLIPQQLRLLHLKRLLQMRVAKRNASIMGEELDI
jgi:hypothetical protein